MKKITFIVLLLALLNSGCGSSAGAGIQASGQIEAKEVAISPEISGRVVEVNVSEGDLVKVDDALLRLDDSLLMSEKQSAQAALDSANASVQTAQAALDSAQAQYDLALSIALSENPIKTEWKKSKPSDYDQPVWYFSKEERVQSAQAEVDAAKAALEKTLMRLEEIKTKAGSSDFLDIEKKLSDARFAYDVAKKVLDNVGGASDSAKLHDAAKIEFDDAKIKLDDVQKDYDDALTTDGAKDVLEVRANVEVARERVNVALSAMFALQTGVDSPEVVAAEKLVEQAKAGLEQSRAAVSAAQSNLDLIQIQLDKLIVRAPMDGVVLVKSIDVGEVLQAGMPAMSIGKLDSLKVTVYIPETEYGQISLGQTASLSIDSFPDETFAAVITRIADQAEFTPQNVQTKEGRQTTVYAIELTVDNADGKLKPGMPVDVTFENAAIQQ